MTGAAKVTTQVIDLTNRVQPSGSYASGIVIESKIGPVNTPVLVSGQTDFLRKFTLDETIEIGWDNAFFEAWQYLKTYPNLYVVRAAKTTGEFCATYGGCRVQLYNSEFDNAPMSEGFVIEHDASGEVPFVEPQLVNRAYKELPDNAEPQVDDTTGEAYYTFNSGITKTLVKVQDKYRYYAGEDDVAFVIYGSSEGGFANDLAISIITDPEEVKLDECFIVRLYRKNKKDQYIKLGDYTCSLNPSKKDGYGTNCYITNVLGSNKYIRAIANQTLSMLKQRTHIVNVSASVTLKNPYLYDSNNRLITKTWSNLIVGGVQSKHQEGEIIVVPQIAGKPAYYECTQGGYSSEIQPSRSAWVNGNSYIETVTEGEVTWTLREVVVPYVSDDEVSAGKTVEVQSGLIYKAMNSGRTSSRPPQTWGADTVEDKDIVWQKQIQTKQIDNKGNILDGTDNIFAIGYTNYAGSAAEVPSTMKIFGDEYLGAELELPKTLMVTDVTTYDPINIHERKRYTVSYKYKTTDQVSQEHFMLPKAHKKVNGAYEFTKLNGGFDGEAVDVGDRIQAMNTLSSTAQYQFQLMQDGGQTIPSYASAIKDLCDNRKQETHGIISTPLDCDLGRISGYAVDDVIQYRRELPFNSSTMELYTTHQLIYDEFNDRNIYVSPSCFMAANILRYAQELGWHWAVAGYKRGKINSLDVAYTFDEAELDRLADNQCNMIIKELGEGIICWDELTLLSQACDLQDGHIARYVDLYLRPTLKKYHKGNLFEFNDEETRLVVKKQIDLFMEGEKAGRAVYDYRTICDESNNLPEDIEANIMNCWLLIKPTKIAKWIKQDVILTPYGIDFGEAVTMM